jgi:hypothetical protein
VAEEGVLDAELVGGGNMIGPGEGVRAEEEDRPRVEGDAW